MKITRESKSIKIEGHVGRWDVIDVGSYEGKEAFLLEHTTYGEDEASLIIDSSGRVLEDEVYNGFPSEEWN